MHLSNLFGSFANAKASHKDQLIYSGAYRLYQNKAHVGVCGVAELPLPSAVHVLSQR